MLWTSSEAHGPVGANMDVWAQLPKKAASAKRERVTDVPPLQFSTFAILADRIVATQQAILPPAGDNVSGTYVARKWLRAPCTKKS